MKKFLVLASISILLGGCTTTANYEKMLSSWVGASEEGLISSWGPPSRVYSSGSNKYLTYDKSASGYVPGTAPTYTTTVIGNTAYTNTTGGSSGYSYSRNCNTTFTIVNGAVKSWRWEGNACRM